MSEENLDQPAAEYRCTRCDTVVPFGADRCVMCGLMRSAMVPVTSTGHAEPSVADTKPANEPPVGQVQSPASQLPSDEFRSTIRVKRSGWQFWLVAGLVGGGLLFGWLALRDRGPEVMAAFLPSPSPVPATVTNTPTWTPIATETRPPENTPTPSSTPPPTSTPRPPRFHTVESGETLFGLSLLYRIAAESIAAVNGFGMDAPIQSGQALEIPWPSPTPPLESMIIDINGEAVVADVTDCQIVTIQDGDSAYALSVNQSVPLEAIVQVNRQTAESIQLLQPGDTLCIPRIVYADTLPPTPGPSPTPLPTPLPGGPSLLYPVNGAQIEAVDDPLLLQWTAVKDLTDNEWYMVELLDEAVDEGFPRRGFTRDTSFRVPSDWRPVQPELQPMRWQVSIVQVNGQRSDGTFTYTYGGESSRPNTFNWLGMVPTAIPLPTATMTPTPE